LQFKMATGVVLALGTAGVMWVGGFRVQGSGFRVQDEGGLTVGGLLVLLSYLASLYAPLETLAYLSTGFATASAGARRVFDVLDNAQELTDSPTATALPVLRGNGRSVVWENVSFGYQEGAQVLHDISLEAKAGAMLAVVGPTGAGKSTLVSLAARLCDP